MFDNNALIELRDHNGVGSREMDVFCYVAYYPYLNA